MPSHWMAVDHLVRELGSLRKEALALDPVRVEAAIFAQVERTIEDVARAVDATIDGPEDDELLIVACEAIVVARTRIRTLRGTVAESERIVARSVELRRRAARSLFESITRRAGP